MSEEKDTTKSPETTEHKEKHVKEIKKEFEKLEQKPFELSPETIERLAAVIEPFVDKYLRYKEMETEKENKYLETASKHDRKIINVLLAFLVSLLGGMAVLTYLGKVSGDALLFAVGGSIGYVFALIQRFIFGSRMNSED